MKSLLPSLKEKKRYLFFKILTDGRVDKKLCADAIFRACVQTMGELGVARAGVLFLGETYNNNVGVIRVNSKYVDEVKLSLAMIQEIAGKRASFDVTKVSGVLKKLKPSSFNR